MICIFLYTACISSHPISAVFGGHHCPGSYVFPVRPSGVQRRHDGTWRRSVAARWSARDGCIHLASFCFEVCHYVRSVISIFWVDFCNMCVFFCVCVCRGVLFVGGTAVIRGHGGNGYAPVVRKTCAAWNLRCKLSGTLGGWEILESFTVLPIQQNVMFAFPFQPQFRAQ